MNDFRDFQNLTETSEEERDQIDLLEYVRLAWKHKWSILGLALFGTLWAMFIASSKTPIYQSTATLLLEEPMQGRIINIQDVYATDSKSYHATQIDILNSQSLAEKVMERLDMTPELPTEQTEPESEPRPSSMIGEIRELVVEQLKEQLQVLGWRPAEYDHPSRTEVIKLGAINRFRGGLTVTTQQGKSKLIHISYRSPDRHLAARVPNALAEVYIESELEARLQMTSKANTWLMERLSGLREKLRESETALQDYREKEDIVAINGSSTLTGQRLESASTQLNEAEKRRNQIRMSLEQIRGFSHASIERLNSVPAIMEDGTFASLRQREGEAQQTVEAYSKRYGPKHPTMVEAQSNLESARENVRARLDLILAGLEEEYKIANANVANLRRQVNAATDEIQQLNRKSHELSVLEREVETNRQLYDRFLSRFKETKEASDLEKVTARVVDPAAPSLGPIYPNKKKITSTGTLIGLAIGLALAFLLELMDKTLKGPKEIEEKLRISSLGAIPHIRLKKRRKETPLDHARDNPNSFFAESIRTMRTGVLLSGLDNPKKVILVTSSIPGEGKSTVAMNLANSIGDMEKVLLIDADMRRPTVAKHWGLAKETKGLSEFVSQTAKLGECVHAIEDSKVYVMPSGAVPPNPLELLSSKRFAASITGLSNTFDYIIIDSAPTLAVSDALVLSSHVSGVVYVIKAASTPSPLVRDGIKRLQKANAHIIGGVLNSMPITTKNKGYGRYRYLGYYHKEYYGSYGYSKETGV